MAVVLEGVWKPWRARPRLRAASIRPSAKDSRQCSVKRWPEKVAGSRAATWLRQSPPETWWRSKKCSGAGHFLGIGLGSLINLLGPEIVIVGGGVAGALGDPYLEIVRASARAQAITDPQAKIAIDRAAWATTPASSGQPPGPRTVRAH